MRVVVALCAMALVVGTGCDSEDGGEYTGTGESKTQSIQPSVGGEITVDEATISIPAGALTATTSIRVESTILKAPSQYEAVSPVYLFEPDGLTFAQPVTVRFPNRAGAANAVIYWTTPGTTDTYELAASSRVEGDFVVAEVDHFSRGFAARAAGGGADVTGGDVFAGDAMSTDTAGTTDAAAPSDTATASDATSTDTGAPSDASVTDAGGPTDATPTDSGSPGDATPPEDTGPTDAGSPMDVAPTDGGPSPDVEPGDAEPTDSGPSPDVDPGDTEPSDAGPSPDVDPSVDAGSGPD